MYCRFKWDGVSLVMVRTPATTPVIDFDLTWSQLKAGVMGDLQSDPNSQNYFIGLENLHTLLSQADYRLHLSMWSDAAGAAAGNYYENFHIGDEASSYALSYTA